MTVGFSAQKIVLNSFLSFSPKLLKICVIATNSAPSNPVLEKAGFPDTMFDQVVDEYFKVCDALAKARPSPTVISIVEPSLST